MGNLLWKKNVREVVPYIPGDQPTDPKKIKLNTNENPYAPAPGVEKLLKDADASALRLYPSTNSAKLTAELAKRFNVKEENIFVGVGSDDVLGMIFLAFFNGGKQILFPEVSYSFYETWAGLFKIPYFKCPLREDFTIDYKDYIPVKAGGRNSENGGIVIANPNAPTSIAMKVSELEEIVKSNPESVVVIDEAYVDFGAESAVSLYEKYDNVLIVQTFSKSRSLAGLRVGYAIGQKELISDLYSVRNSYNSYTMSTLAIECGAESVKDEAYFKEKVEMIINTRAFVKTELEKLGFTVLNSSTNFLFATTERMPAKEIFEKLREKHIYVRYFSKPERISNYLRITVGTDDEMKKFLCELNDILG